MLKVIGLLPTMGKRKPAKDGGSIVYTMGCCDEDPKKKGSFS
jgi:hypothetical protein